MLHPGHPVRFRTGLRGFTLLEVLFATAILAVAGYYLFESFLGTTRLATTSAATLGEVSVGRTVLEQFVDQVANDPTCIGRLCHGKPWTHWGYVVRPKAPITAPDGQPISEACPYTQYLFNLSGTSGLDALIAQAGARLAAAPSARVRQAMIDLCTSKAQLLLDAFRRCRKTLADLDEKHEAFARDVSAVLKKLEAEVGTPSLAAEKELEALPNGFAEGFAQLAAEHDAALKKLREMLERYGKTRKQVSELSTRFKNEMETQRRLIRRAKLFEWYVTAPEFRGVLERLQKYPRWFQEALDRGLAATTLACPDDKPLMWTFAVQARLELQQARKMLEPGWTASPPAKEPPWSFRALADYQATRGPQVPVSELRLTYPSYDAVLADFVPMGAPANPADRMLGQYEQEGQPAAAPPVSTYLSNVGTAAACLVRDGVSTVVLEQTLGQPATRERLTGAGMEVPPSIANPNGKELLEPLFEAVNPAFATGLARVDQLEGTQPPGAKDRFRPPVAGEASQRHLHGIVAQRTVRVKPLADVVGGRPIAIVPESNRPRSPSKPPEGDPGKEGADQ